MSEVDIIILGSGVSGCSTAALLAQKGYDVCIVSPTIETKHHLPESWIINYPKYFSFSEIQDALSSSFSHQNECVFTSNDGLNEVKVSLNSHSDKFTTGDLVKVNRDSFDRVLLEKAIESGARFLKFDRLIDFKIESNEVQLNIEVNEKVVNLRAPYIIDASGKSAFLINELKLPTTETKLDSRLACFSHFVPNGEKLDAMRIVSIDNGYLFCIPTFTDRISIGCVIPESSIGDMSNAEEIFSKGLSQSTYVSKLVGNSERVLPYIPIKNTQRVCLEPAGTHYCIIGDAAAFMDPFFCPGIDFAFSSAEQAALTFVNKTPEKYRTYLSQWLAESKLSVYEKIDRSKWSEMMRLFADPHQPILIPLLLTQAFGQVAGSRLPLHKGVALAREAYDAKVY